MIGVREIRRLELEGGGHLSAASGLVLVRDRLYVAADDEVALGVFEHPGGPGRLAPIFAEELPADTAARKARKPDLEALVLLPGALLALGSGSTPARERAARWPLDDHGRLAGEAEILDLSGFYAEARAAVGALNIEGACLVGGELRLFHRGAGMHGVSAVIRAGADLRPGSLLGVREYDLGGAGAVRYSFTDACALEDGWIVFTAAAEDTPNAYDDGEVTGSAVGLLDPTGDVARLEPLDAPGLKVEGVHAERTAAGIELLLVADADDPAVAAPLLTATL